MHSPQFVQHLSLKRLQILWGIYVIPFPFLIIGLHFSLCSLKNVTSSWKAAFSNCPVTWKTSGQPVFSHGVEVQSKTVKSFLMWSAICKLSYLRMYMPPLSPSPSLCPSQAVQLFINETWMERYHTGISEQMLTFLWSIIVSIFTIGGLVGSSLGGTLSIKCGR